ncbi:MAG: CRISPR-associated protein Cmr6 [Candidatus Sumerlaeota bacterium]|nr:CRISPR-associated protein Cmr6 [Candidatus Sumerlaeota bacterium]
MSIIPHRLQSVERLVSQVELGCHPGLMLDKLLKGVPEKSEYTGDLARSVVAARGDNDALKHLLARRSEKLAAVGAQTWTQKTVAPMALHLARASLLENANVCLHRTYGFAYLPGSGLKGMARAWAETVWRPAQTDKTAAQRTIDRIFGFADTKERKELLHENPDVAVFGPDDKEIKSHAGAIVFHDAWPTKWPELVIDILACHHDKYYKGEGAPGDWESPNLVNFLTVKSGTEFGFALSLAVKSGTESYLKLAATWLKGALTWVRAGAKTNAGYGQFAMDSKEPVVLPEKSHHLPVSLKLVSRAFLGGSTGNAENVLRTSSLRGLMRAWWRAGNSHLSLNELREREESLFGHASLGGKLATAADAVTGATVSVENAGIDFGGGGSKLGYLAYGPVGYSKEQKKNISQRASLRAGQNLHLRLQARDEESLTEGFKALWLMAALGGVGARSRRGWGSVMLDACVGSRDFHDKCGLPYLAACSTTTEYAQHLRAGLNRLVPEGVRPEPDALDWLGLSTGTTILVSTGTFPTYEAALEDLATHFMNFRSRLGQNRNNGEPGEDYHLTKHALENGTAPDSLPKRAQFGLPYLQTYRSLDGVTGDYTPMLEGKDLRRASSVLFKVVRLENGKFLWQVAYLPSRFLPEGAEIKLQKKLPKKKERESSRKKKEESSVDLTGEGNRLVPPSASLAVVESFLLELAGQARCLKVADAPMPEANLLPAKVEPPPPPPSPVESFLNRHNPPGPNDRGRHEHFVRVLKNARDEMPDHFADLCARCYAIIYGELAGKKLKPFKSDTLFKLLDENRKKEEP